ncbi:MAG: hypothetical protein JSV84_17365 [Gemmatimonadota bacterium]|nr:MAG: hypothetical protein JSV84_17365 [Gemmatimonadota bacterium]
MVTQNTCHKFPTQTSKLIFFEGFEIECVTRLPLLIVGAIGEIMQEVARGERKCFAGPSRRSSVEGWCDVIRSEGNIDHGWKEKKIYGLLYSQAVIPAPVIEYGVNSVPESPRLAQPHIY